MNQDDRFFFMQEDEAGNRSKVIESSLGPDAALLISLEKYFSSISNHPGEIAWRMSCYRAGSDYAAEIEKRHFPLAGKKVLDMSCAWGGHTIAFAARGAHVTAADLNDHRFDALRTFCDQQKLPVRVIQADCQAVPVDEKFDVILALDLIEHIPDPAAMAAEIKRLLRPGGVCIITTPPKLLSVVWGEPHWHLKGLTLLPFRWQGWIARRLFGRTYPFPIERQYTRASQVGALFAGMKYKAIPASRKLPLPSLFWGRIEITH